MSSQSPACPAVLGAEAPVWPGLGSPCCPLPFAGPVPGWGVAWLPAAPQPRTQETGGWPCLLLTLLARDPAVAPPGGATGADLHSGPEPTGLGLLLTSRWAGLREASRERRAGQGQQGDLTGTGKQHHMGSSWWVREITEIPCDKAWGAGRGLM